MSYWRDEIGELSEIRRMGEDELSVEWRIRDVLSMHDWYASPVFVFGNERWSLSVLPNWESDKRNPASGWLRLSLGRHSADLRKTFHLSVGIRGRVSGGVEKTREVEYEFSEEDYCFQWDDFCSRSELVEQRTRLMPDGVLTITCILKRPGVAKGQQSSGECIICYEKPADCALYRCGHMCMCFDCSFKLWRSNSSNMCPICRKSIVDVIKIYK